MSALTASSEGGEEQILAEVVSIVRSLQPATSMIEHWFKLYANYSNILGEAHVDKQSYLDRCRDTEHLILELGERAAEHLIIDTAMFKTELALYESDGWWGGTYEAKA